MVNDFWNLVKKSESEVDLYIYTVVHPYGEASLRNFKQALDAAGTVKKINVYINSVGGSVMEGIGIYNYLKRHSAEKVAYIDGFACSIASVVAMACDRVCMPENACMMIHNVWTYVEGNAKQLRKAADDLEVLNNSAVKAYLAKAGDKVSEQEIRDMMDGETWLTANQCITYGFADEIEKAKPDIESAKQMLAQAKAEGIERYENAIERICAAMNRKGNGSDFNSNKETAVKIITEYFK